MSQLRVTFCIYDKPGSVGGPVSWVQRLIPVLRDSGMEVRCLFLLHYGETGQALDALRREGFDCRSIVAHDRTEDRVRWILEQLRENPPDVFVPNLVVAGYYAARWAKEAGIPTVGILHSDDEYYRALQSEFVSGAPAYRLSSVVCVSKELERQVVDRKPATTVVRRIPYGVPVPAERARRAEDPLRIAFAGRLAEEQKRISEVTRALCRAVREIPGTEAVLYGDGAQRETVERILATEGAGLPVSLAGFVASGDIQQRFLEADVIVLLSDYEGLPIALMEAMACGCVPVCLNMRSGIPELVEDGVTGLLVTDRGEDFVRAVRQLKSDPLLLQRLSRSARDRIASEFSNQVCGAAWADHLRELGGHPHPRRRIRVPRRLRLPKFNPALESPEQRAGVPSLPLRLFRRGRIFGGQIKRILLNRTAND